MSLPSALPEHLAQSKTISLKNAFFVAKALNRFAGNYGICSQKAFHFLHNSPHQNLSYPCSPPFIKEPFYFINLLFFVKSLNISYLKE